MDWVPHLIGTLPRREENGGDQIQKPTRVKRHGFGHQIKSEIAETEIAIESEIQIAIETESEIQNCEIEIKSGKTQIVESEIEIVETEIV